VFGCYDVGLYRIDGSVRFVVTFIIIIIIIIIIIEIVLEVHKQILDLDQSLNSETT